MTIKFHVASIHVMSLPPKNVIVAITRFDTETKDIDQVRSNLMTEEQAKRIERVLKSAVKEKGFLWK